jgi:hypothetical protein
MNEDIYTQIARLRSHRTMSHFATASDYKIHGEGYREAISDMAELAHQESRLAAPSVASGAQELPPLPKFPEADYVLARGMGVAQFWSAQTIAQMMHAYARAAIAAQAKPMQAGELPALPWQTKENGGDLAAWLEARSDTEIANEFSEYGQECYLQAVANSAPKKALVEALQGITALYDTDEGCRGTPEYIAARAALKAAGKLV